MFAHVVNFKKMLQLLLFFSNRDLDKLELPVYSVKGHESIINTIDGVGGLGIGGGAPEIVTGSRDGKYILKWMKCTIELLF